MHRSVRDWVSGQVDRHDLASGSVLEVGALDVNGTVRDLFVGPYVATDMRPGPGVDMVVNAHDLVATFGDRRFGVVVCCEMLEHDPAFWLSMGQMGALLADGGRLLLTTRGIGFPYHEYPGDFWRFTVDAGRELGVLAGLSEVEVFEDPEAPGIFLTGVKPVVTERGDS